MELRFRQAMPADRPQMMALWRLCFPEDDEGFVCRFFEEIPITTGIVACKGDVLAMLFLLPAQVVMAETVIPVYYLYAGCTHPSHRGRGIYPALMEYAAGQAAQSGAEAIYLHPATASLADYYRRLGYRDGIGCHVWRPRNGQTAERLSAVSAAEYVAMRGDFFPGNRPVWRLDPPYEGFFLREMVSDGWRPFASSAGCVLLAPDDSAAYDHLLPDGALLPVNEARGINGAGVWENTAQWIPTKNTSLEIFMAEMQAYTAFLGDI